MLDWIQGKLDFVDCHQNAAFATPKSLGRVASVGTLLGVILGVHLTLLVHLVLSYFDVSSLDDNYNDHQPQQQQQRLRVLLPLIQWCTYVSCLCYFHLSEFFVTALYNDTSILTGDAFMVNHSKAYTAAALIAWTEFWVRYCLFPSSFLLWNSSSWTSVLPVIPMIGLAFVAVGQITRTLAMKTCGKNFNHLIQRHKKENHVLITSGIYAHLRHPSYFGFFYWAIGMQMMLGNPISTILSAGASWTFFRRRIPYEEDTLCEHFPNYKEYARRTWIGIPFL